MSIFVKKHIILGVTGSIAAYKAADLASKLTQAGALVDVILSPAAEKFVTPLTFQSVTGRRAFTESDLWGGEAHVLHVGLGHSTDLLAIAPCTANTIAKLANGIADNLLTITALAASSPLLIAPAMDAGMFSHPATQENLALLRERKVIFAGPVEGRMASGLIGLGRMLEPEQLLGHMRLILGSGGPLHGKKVVVTAGGTREPLDPVRMLTNKSSGKQGYALAQAALDAGATVSLVTTSSILTPPVGANVIEASTAETMKQVILEEAAAADVLLMAAAVSDFRPKTTASEKIKKQDGIPQVVFEASPDILETIADPKNKKQRPRLVIGFAAESDNLLENASKKLRAKKLDMIVANDISSPDSGFSVDTNRVVLLYPDGQQEPLALMSKAEVSQVIIERAAALLESV